MKTKGTSRAASTSRTRHKNKRESGIPGGGQGRRDVVRGSKIYPMSGPLPRGNAVIRTEAAWGQGDRGAAGYEESGRSGLQTPAYGGRLPRGARRTKAAVRRQPSRRQPPTEELREIPERRWMKYFNGFSRRYDGWLAEVEVETRGRAAARRVEARRLPFEGITVDLKRGAHKTTAVILEMQPNVHLTHMVPNTRKIRVRDELPDIEVQITAANGEKTTVHFQQRSRELRLLPPPKR